MTNATDAGVVKKTQEGFNELKILGSIVLLFKRIMLFRDTHGGLFSVRRLLSLHLLEPPARGSKRAY